LKNANQGQIPADLLQKVICLQGVLGAIMDELLLGEKRKFESWEIFPVRPGNIRGPNQVFSLGDPSLPQLQSSLWAEH
jgi:hypothetical protein